MKIPLSQSLCSAEVDRRKAKGCGSFQCNLWTTSYPIRGQMLGYGTSMFWFQLLICNTSPYSPFLQGFLFLPRPFLSSWRKTLDVHRAFPGFLQCLTLLPPHFGSALSGLMWPHCIWWWAVEFVPRVTLAGNEGFHSLPVVSGSYSPSVFSLWQSAWATPFLSPSFCCRLRKSLSLLFCFKQFFGWTGTLNQFTVSCFSPGRVR